MKKELFMTEKTLRDEFAMAALTGLFASKYKLTGAPDWDAVTAYEYADAMLKAREER